MRRRGQIAEGQHFLDLVAQRGLGGASATVELGHAPDAELALQREVRGDEDVVEHGELGEHLGVLERLDETSGRDLVGAEAAHVLALPQHRAGARRSQPRDHVEERRLAGTVRADDADDLAALDRERHVRDGDQAADALGDRADLKQHAVPSTPRAIPRCRGA